MSVNSFLKVNSLFETNTAIILKLDLCWIVGCFSHWGSERSLGLVKKLLNKTLKTFFEVPFCMYARPSTLKLKSSVSAEQVHAWRCGDVSDFRPDFFDAGLTCVSCRSTTCEHWDNGCNLWSRKKLLRFITCLHCFIFIRAFIY